MNVRFYLTRNAQLDVFLQFTDILYSPTVYIEISSAEKQVVFL